MAKLRIKKDTTDVTVYAFIQDSSVSTGDGLTGLLFNTANLECYYVRPGGNSAQLALANVAVTGAHTDGGFVEVDSTHMPGVYRLDLSDAIVATGVDSVVVMLHGAADMAPCVLELQLVDYTNDDLNTSISGLNDISVADILAGTIEGAYDVKDVLMLMSGVLVGKLSGGGSGTITFRNLSDTADRVVATVDGSGNRLSVTKNV